MSYGEKGEKPEGSGPPTAGGCGLLGGWNNKHLRVCGPCSEKTAEGDSQPGGSGCGRVPIKLYLQNHMVGWAWPVGSDLPTPRLGDWRRQWHPTPVLLPGKSHGRRRLVGFSPWGC